MDQTGWELGEDADGDDERDAVADPALGDLIAQPHQEHRPGSHGNDCHQLKSGTGLRDQIQSQTGDGIHDAGKERIRLGILEGLCEQVTLKEAQCDS